MTNLGVQQNLKAPWLLGLVSYACVPGPRIFTPRFVSMDFHATICIDTSFGVNILPYRFGLENISRQDLHRCKLWREFSPLQIWAWKYFKPRFASIQVLAWKFSLTDLGLKMFSRHDLHRYKFWREFSPLQIWAWKCFKTGFASMQIVAWVFSLTDLGLKIFQATICIDTSFGVKILPYRFGLEFSPLQVLAWVSLGCRVLGVSL